MSGVRISRQKITSVLGKVEVIMLEQIELKLLSGKALTADEQAWLDGMVNTLRSFADEAMAFVERAFAAFLDAIRPIVQGVLDMCWSMYLADGAIYGETTGGMVAWWRHVNQANDYYMRN
jgi:hypothetical protein